LEEQNDTDTPTTPRAHKTSNKRPKIVLVAGFESFNKELYRSVNDLDLEVTCFSDSDIRKTDNEVSMDPNDLKINPIFANAVREADAFVGSLIFDYDDVLAVQSLLDSVKGPRLIFESATELMEFNSLGTFTMKPGKEGPAGPPPAVKAILSKFGSGKEEDKLAGYLKLLKVGPDLLSMWYEVYLGCCIASLGCYLTITCFLLVGINRAYSRK
jgi:magnesium chelatase subunit H